MCQSLELINNNDNLSIHKGETHGLAKQQCSPYVFNKIYIDLNLKVDHLSI